ncbi:MAG: hypothetical protein CMN32_03980 [Saprospirales bacterium]|nr:hypothetical protein [Saprospirales bacterium]
MSGRKDDILSTEVSDLLDSRPWRLLTWGTAILIALVVLFMAAGYIVTIPESVRGNMTLTTTEPPVSVIAPAEGYIARVLVTDRQAVEKGDLLAVYATTANVDDVMQLEKDVARLSNFELADIQAYRPNMDLSVGELDVAYSNFVNAVSLLPEAIDNAGYAGVSGAMSGKAANLRSSLQFLNKRLEDNQRKIDSLWRKFHLAKQSLEKTSNEVYAQEQLDAKKEIDLLEKQREQLLLEKQRVQRDLMDQKANQLESSFRQQEGVQSRLLRFQEELTSLRSAIEDWKARHLVLSPLAGKVYLYSSLRENTFVNKGQELAVVFPNSEQLNFLAQVTISSKGSGKVKEGQRVVLQFDRYPASEFGFVRGVVEKINLLPQGGEYFVEVALPEGLRTSTGKELEFNYQLSGTADIYTDEKVLFHYLFDELTASN